MRYNYDELRMEMLIYQKEKEKNVYKLRTKQNNLPFSPISEKLVN